MNFLVDYEKIKKIVDENLCSYIEEIKDTRQNILYESMVYSLKAGGKRIRPILHLSIIELLGGDVYSYLDSACALEYIHTYSLIHDDLPAMDNDDYRRGKLTNHKVFGEDIAILSGDALLNTASSILINKAKKDFRKNILEGIGCILNSSGISGMIAGQVVDLQAENQKISIETLEYIHNKKTSALIEASIMSACHFMDADKDVTRRLDIYAKNIGLAFQISDDILDVEGDFEALGKCVGSDINNNKSTFVSILGLEKSKEILKKLIDDAIIEASFFGSDFLIELANFVSSRKL